jgi:signal transduction histidine kinase
VVLEAHAQDATVVIRVSDQGAGLPVGFDTRAFDRFSRGSGARAEGRGLGLAIVKAIVTAHDGDESSDGRAAGAGVVVTVRLPVAGTATT